MAAAAPPHVSAPLLNQKQRRAAQRKERRKRKRQALAQARECGASPRPDEEEEEVNDDDDEAERLRLHEEWLEKERLAQEEFRLKAEREEAARLRKEEEERMIKEEWEAQQRREQEEREQKQQEKRGREEAVQKMLDEAESQLENGGPWMNPEAPATQSSENFGTERDVANCPFFLKTGACRFGDRCSRKHIHPTSSPTLMIRGMFTTFSMEEACRDDYDIDAWVEHTEEDLQEAFLDFYHDVLPELKSVGKVVQFKVSCNYEPHLRGNVYVQFDTEEQCKDAFIRFNGRWYAGRQLHCEICPVTRWKNAICGLFDRQKCPKGKHCNFLHVFRNPSSEFWEADRDLHMSPDRSVRGSRRDGWRSERSDRSWRQRRGSRSPPRSERSQSRRDGDRRRSRSRSRERRGSYQHREDRWSSRTRHSDRRSDWHPRRSRDRSRSRSRDRERDRWRDRSKEREDRRRSGSRERESRDKDADIHRKARERSRSSSREERNKSPKDGSTRHRHKRSKKSKKKNKKKHRKKKSRVSEGTSSSGESEQEEESKEEGHADVNPEDQSDQKMNGTELVQETNEVDESERAEDENTDSAEVKLEEPSTEPETEPAGECEPSVT